MDNQSYQRELVAFEQDIWRLSQFSRSLQEFREEISQGWDDNASREINGKYLGIHREENEKIIENLNSQHKYLGELNSQLAEINKYEEEINTLSRNVNILFQQSENYIQNSNLSLDESIEKKHESRKNLKKANEMLAKIKSLE